MYNEIMLIIIIIIMNNNNNNNGNNDKNTIQIWGYSIAILSYLFLQNELIM